MDKAPGSEAEECGLKSSLLRIFSSRLETASGNL